MAESVHIRITGDASQFNKEVSRLGDKVRKAATGAGNVMRGILGSQIVTQGVSMLVSGFRSAINTGMEFEAAMSQVAAISGATGVELEQLTETAKRFGETTKFSASEAAAALNYMALAGWDAQQSMDALPGVLNLAAASGMDLASASDSVTDFLSAFGMEASQATYMADLMAYAQANANTSASQLSDAYGNCASSMHAAGQDIETTTAMLMALSNQGIKGSEAGTQMAAVMRDITQKMDKGRIMIGSTAVQVTDAAGNFRDLNDIITDVGAAVEGMGSAERSAAVMETFTARSVKAIDTILSEGVDSVNSYEAALRGSAGTAAEQAEIMMDNLQGDVQIFKSALEGLQITASDSFGGIARDVVQYGTSLIEALTAGGKMNGIEGIFDAALDMLPSVFDRILAGIETLAGGIAAKLPALIRKLAGQVPGILKTALNLAPVLIESILSAAGEVVEELVANLPNFIAMIFESLPDILLGVFKGALKILDGLFDGLGRMFKSHVPDLSEQVASAFDDINISGIHVDDVQLATISVDGEIDTSAYRTRIATAKTEIQAAIASLNLTDAEAADLESAILRGSGADALRIALGALNVPEETINTVTGSIRGFREKMDEVFAEFNVDDSDGSVTNGIADYLSKGGSLQEALQLFAGLSATDAKAAAEKLQPDLDAAVSAINALNLEGVDTSTIYSACLQANGDIVAALTLLGADDTTIEAAMASVETLQDSITARLSAAFEAIKTAFTNGDAADDAEAAKTALEELDEAAEIGHSNIDSWLAEYTKQLNTMNLSAEDYETAVTNAQEKAQAMHAELDSTIQEARDWVTQNAGAKTDEVRSHINDLELIMQDIEDLDARVQALRDQLSPREYAVRSAVEQGLVTSQNMQATAIALTSKEYEEAILSAAADYARAEEEAADIIQQAYTDYAEGLITEDERNARIGEAESMLAEALETRSAAEQAAADNYNAHMEAIGMAIIGAEDEVAAALEEPKRQARLQHLAEALAQGIIGAFENNGAGAITVDQLLESLGLTESDLQELADGIGMSLDELRTLLETALNSNTPGAELEWSNFGEAWRFDVDQAIAEALAGIDPSELGSAAAVLQKAIEEGWLANTEDFDWSNREGALAKILTDYVESEFRSTEVPTPELEIEPEPEVKVEPDRLHDSVEEAIEHGSYVAEDLTVPVAATPEPEIDTAKAEDAAEEAAEAVSEACIGRIGGSLRGSMAEVFMDGAEGGADGLRAGEPLVGAAASELAQILPDAARDTLDSHSPSRVMQGIGMNAGQGLANGLNASAPIVLAAATRLATLVADTIRAALQIHSPSKVMAKLGAFTGEGFGIGLRDSISEAIRAAQSIAGVANIAPKMDFSGITGALSGSVQSIADIENERPINLYVNGKRVGQALRRDNASASNQYNRSVALGVGK